MSEQETEVIFHGAFDQFRQNVLPYVQVPGAPAVIGTARARRRTHLITAAVVVVVALAIPAVAFGVLRGTTNAVPQPGTPTAPSPTGSAPATPSPTAGPVATTPTVGAGELANALLPVDWSGSPATERSCTSGPIQFTNGAAQSWPDPPGQSIIATARADVDRAGQPDVVVELACRYAEAAEKQVAAYRITAPGRYELIGVVTHTLPDTLDLTEFAVDSTGVVQVRMADRSQCCGVPDTAVVRQWRGFAWTGNAFNQVSGPTSFDADPAVADVKVSAPTVQLGPVVDGYRSATLRITVRNNGPQAAASVRVYIAGNGLPDAGGDWSRCSGAGDDVTSLNGLICTVGTLSVGQAVQLTLPVRIYSETTPTTFRIQARLDDRKYPEVVVPSST